MDSMKTKHTQINVPPCECILFKPIKFRKIHYLRVGSKIETDGKTDE